MLRKLTGIAAVMGGLPAARACLGYDGGLPEATETIQISEPIYVRSGEVFDAGWAKYDRNPSTCNEQVEGGEADTAFVVESGGTLRNVIIGASVGEGVYCVGGGCTFEFVWFEDVCEDAISIVRLPISTELYLGTNNSLTFSNRKTTLQGWKPTSWAAELSMLRTK